MASSSRMDCSLDQIIDQSASQNSQRQRREPTKPIRRVVTTANTRGISGPNDANKVNKYSGKRQAPTTQTHNVQHRSNQQRLTPSEAAIHSSQIRQEPNGDVVVSLKNTDVLIAQAATGDLILNSGGYRTFTTRAVLCAALQPVGLKVDGDANKPDEEDTNDNWVVSDGRAFLQKFEDGMTVSNISRLSRLQVMARPSVILQYMQQKKAGLAKKVGKPHFRGPSRNQVKGEENEGMLEAVDE